jgi:hypothetical protein
MAVGKVDNGIINQQRESMEMRQSLRHVSISPQEFLNASLTEEEESTMTLSEDTFSFLIVAPICSISFITRIIVLVVKTTMYTLVLADMMTKGTIKGFSF